MNRRHTNPAARLFAAFAVIAVVLASSPAARAGSHDAKLCPHASCQPQPVGHGCCDGDPLHECLAMTEAFNRDKDQYGTDRIEVLMGQHGSTDAQGLVEAFEASLVEFRNGREAFDDTTLLVAQLS